MLLFDGHLDLAMNAVSWNRDLGLPVHETRRLETGMTQKGRGRGTVAFPDMCAGGVGLCIATVLARVQKPGNPLPGYRTAESAFAAAQGELAYYRVMQEEGVLRMITDWPSLEAHAAAWKQHLADPQAEASPTAGASAQAEASPTTGASAQAEASPTAGASAQAEACATKAPPIGMVLTMEGADPVVYPEQVHRWKADGLRCIGLSHYGLSNYAYGTSTEGGLTDLGRAILPEIKAAGLILDLTHLADQAFWEALEAFDGPVQCSHQNCRALVPGDRQMDDAQLRAVIERGGTIGTALDAWMLQPGWVKGETQNNACDLSTVADHIDHVCQLAGNSLHAAIGSDLDGGYGQEQTPHDLDTIGDLQRVPELLRARGYGEQDIENVVHGNLLGLFRRAWGGA